MALKRIFEQNLQPSPAAASNRMSQMTLVYSGGGGGVGVSTIIGTLGRLLSSRGDRVLLVDSAPQSTLGFFFSGETAPEGVSSFGPESYADSGNSQRGRVNIACRPPSPTDALRVETAESWVWRAITQLGPEADRILVDIWPGISETSHLRALAAGTPLVVIAPDIRCVLGIGRLLKVFASHERALGRAIVPYFVLNLFDPDVPFHLEMLERLQEQLGDRLLPMFIPRSDQISEATAEGQTIVDFNKGASAATGFLRLADWVQHLMPVETVNRFGPAQPW